MPLAGRLTHHRFVGAKSSLQKRDISGQFTRVNVTMRSIKNGLNAVANYFGYQVDSLGYLAQLSDASGTDSWLHRRQLLMRHRKIDCVLDVGASEGQFAESLRALGYRNRIISFEPRKNAFQQLQRAAEGDRHWQCENYALGDSEGRATINVAGNSFSSSFLRMRQIHADAAPASRYVGTETVTIRRLDDVFPQLVGDRAAVYLKIDVQGYEKHVLEGGLKSLLRTSMVQIEASLCSMYEGDTTIAETIACLNAYGFTPVSIEPGFGDKETGRQFQVDILFWRD